jgi:uncharacterized membrane protein YfcA
MPPIVIGLLAGLISGGFGVGGGIIIVPGLVLLLHFTQRLSHGTSLLAIMPIAAAGVIGFGIHGSINLGYALFLGVGSILGAVLGTKLLSSISNMWLARIFSVILLVTAIWLFVDVPMNSEELALTPATAILLIALGVLTGGIAGLLGVGGGIILVPVLILFFGATAPIAKGTSLLIALIAGTAGSWMNYRNENIDIPIALKIGLAGIPTALIGAQLAMVMSDQVSSILFAILLVITAVRLVQTSRKQGK